MSSQTPDQRIPIAHEDFYEVMDYAGPYWTGQPYSLHTKDSVSLAGNLGEGLVVDGERGTTVQGRSMLAATPDDIGVGYYWRFNPVHLSTLASSASMPVPLLVQGTPRILEGAQTIKDGVAQLNAAAFPEAGS